MSRPTPQPRKTPLGARLRDAVSAYPEAAAIGLYAVVAITAMVAAYFWIFTEFAPYDDEGTLLMTLKAFVHGHVLYRDVWSVYGPFYYELFGGLFSLTGWAITTDASRSIVIVIWVGTSLMFGLAAQRLTGRLALGVAGMAVAYSTLNVLANEPMHPQALCVVLLGAFVLLAVSGPTRRVAWAGGGCGVLLAALVLTKVNLGVFGVAAVALAAALAAEPIQRRGWLRWIVILAYLTVPVFVLARDLNLSWVRELLLLETFAAVALMVAAQAARPESDGDGAPTRWLRGAVAGFVVAFVAMVGVILVTGPSLADIYHGMVTEAFRIRDITFGQFPFPPGSAVAWSVIAAGAAVVATRLRAAGVGRSSIWLALVRAGVGLAIWLNVAHVVVIGFNPSSGNPEVVPMLLAWVAAIPPAGVEESAYKRFLRVLLPALAVAETLQVYPTPGSQMGIAAVSFVPVGALCLGDALTELRAWSASRGADHLSSFKTIAGVAAVSLAGILALDAIVLPAFTSALIYREQPKLALPGAELMRLAEPQNEQYTELVSLLHQNDCSTFLGYPTVNSLYLWSGLEAPSPQLPNAWMYALDESQQQMAVEGFRASRRPCAIRDEELAQPYLKGRPPPNTPLMQYLSNNFKPVATVGAFEFMVPKPSATAR